MTPGIAPPRVTDWPTFAARRAIALPIPVPHYDLEWDMSRERGIRRESNQGYLGFVRKGLSYVTADSSAPIYMSLAFR